MAQDVPSWWGQPGAPNWSSTDGAPVDGIEPVAAEGPKGWLIVNIRGWLLTWVRTTISVGGMEATIGYGTEIFHLPPGKHTVRIHARWMRRYGYATMQVVVPPRERVEVYYASPLTQWRDDGNIGLTKQKRPGATAFFLWGTVLFTVLLLFSILITTA